MKIYIPILLALLSFIVGFKISDHLNKEGIDSARQVCEQSLAMLKKTDNELQITRAIDKLDINISTLGFLLEREKDGAPRKYVFESVSDKVENEIQALEKILKEEHSLENKERAVKLIKDGKDLIEKAEFYK